MIFGGSLLAVLPKGFFSWPLATEKAGLTGENEAPTAINDDGERKRRRQEDSTASSIAPALISSVRDVSSTGQVVSSDEESSSRPKKRRRERSILSSVPDLVDVSSVEKKEQKETSDLLRMVPVDVIAHCLSFLGTSDDRFALQTTCKTFRDITNSDAMLEKLDICGNIETGNKGIIRDIDTPSVAAATLAPFARAGNLEALYMLGIVKCYCYQDLKNGILMLKIASQRGYVRSSYSLGIILRDSLPIEARNFMKLAASTGYLPAQLELLPTSEMKRRFGEPNADELRQHLDPLCLVSLLLRDYVESAELRGLFTSHCWNPLCGRWAYKATSNRAVMPMCTPVPEADDLDEELSESVVDRAAAVPRSQQPLVVSPNGTRSLDLPDQGDPLQRPIVTLKEHSCEAIQGLAWEQGGVSVDRVARMKMCSRCCKAKYCSKLCQVYDWRSSQHKMECQFL